MTTIAYDGRTIAADSLACYGDERCHVPIQKIWVEGRVIYALAGSSRMLTPLMKWFKAGASPGDIPKGDSNDYAYTFLVIDDAGVRTYHHDCAYPNFFYEDKIAIGSGQDYAMGALMFGASAKEAVAVAAKMSVKTGGEIQVVDIAEVFGTALAEAAE